MLQSSAPLSPISDPLQRSPRPHTTLIGNKSSPPILPLRSNRRRSTRRSLRTSSRTRRSLRRSRRRAISPAQTARRMRQRRPLATESERRRRTSLSAAAASPAEVRLRARDCRARAPPPRRGRRVLAAFLCADRPLAPHRVASFPPPNSHSFSPHSLLVGTILMMFPLSPSRSRRRHPQPGRAAQRAAALQDRGRPQGAAARAAAADLAARGRERLHRQVRGQGGGAGGAAGARL